MPSIENRYISQIDRGDTNPLDTNKQGFNAEEVVIKFMSTIPGMEVRHATPQEDSGKKQIVKDLAIDIVGYWEGKPALTPQVTTAVNKDVRDEKIADLRDHPFVRLPEMKPDDTPAVRTLTFLDAKGVESYLADPHFEHHPLLVQQIIDSNINSLKFAFLKTRNPKEQERINSLISAFEQTRQFFEPKQKGRSH
jgi:hypothetical protein